MPDNNAYLLLGSNIAPEINLTRALWMLQTGCEVVAVSPTYRTTPQGFTDQADFLNMALHIRTPLTPEALKSQILEPIEQALGRLRDPQNKNAPRTIDLDIVLWNDDCIDYGAKPWHIPDTDILKFAHVAVPLADIAPDYIHPENGETLSQIALHFDTTEMRISMTNLGIPRSEHPNPQFHRQQWMSLNGAWRFSFDQPTLDRTIQVPFPFQAPLSGIGETGFHDIVWYERTFERPTDWQGRCILLHFGAVDYRAWVWVNEAFATYHEGGHTPFFVEIGEMLHDGENTIRVKVEDISTDREQPRGKQYWKEQSASIFYTRTTGIWQPVWIEAVGAAHIENFKITPNIDEGSVQLNYLFSDPASNLSLEITVYSDNKSVITQTHHLEPGQYHLSHTYDLSENLQLWSPEHPHLYNLTLTLKQGDTVLDTINSYFGMRKISIEDGTICLNNQPYYMKLILDQGYHPQGILTYPADEAIKLDIELTKAMGFNGVRKHQKVEDPRYLYWADQVGLLVWGEMANCYEYSEKAVKRVMSEWQEAVERDYNHPCIVAWVPINESWGVPALQTDPRQGQHLMALVHLTKSLDQTRPVISNDGWEHADSDIFTIHDYEGSGEILKEHYATQASAITPKPDRPKLLVPGFSYKGAPILITEFGGIAYRKSQQEGWGYTSASDDADFIQRYEAVVRALLESPVVQGFCYTQLTDVEQEINGLLTYDRQPKVDLDSIRSINNLSHNPG